MVLWRWGRRIAIGRNTSQLLCTNLFDVNQPTLGSLQNLGYHVEQSFTFSSYFMLNWWLSLYDIPAHPAFMLNGFTWSQLHALFLSRQANSSVVNVVTEIMLYCCLLANGQVWMLMELMKIATDFSSNLYRSRPLYEKQQVQIWRFIWIQEFVIWVTYEVG